MRYANNYGSLDISNITSYLKNNTPSNNISKKPKIYHRNSKSVLESAQSSIVPNLEEDFLEYQGKSYNMLDQNQRAELAHLLHMPPHFLRLKFIRYLYKKDITLDQVLNKTPLKKGIYPDKGSILEVPYKNTTYFLSYFALEEVAAKYNIPHSSAKTFQNRKLIYGDPAMQVRLILSRYDQSSHKPPVPTPLNVIQEAADLTKTKYKLALQHYKNKKMFVHKTKPTSITLPNNTIPQQQPSTIPTYVKVRVQTMENKIIEAFLPVYISDYNVIAPIFNTTVDQLQNNIVNLQPIN